MGAADLETAAAYMVVVTSTAAVMTEAASLFHPNGRVVAKVVALAQLQQVDNAASPAIR